MVGASFHTVENLINNLNGVSNGQTNFNPYDSNNQTNFNPLIGKISNIPTDFNSSCKLSNIHIDFNPVCKISNIHTDFNHFQKLLNKYMNFNPHH